VDKDQVLDMLEIATDREKWRKLNDDLFLTTTQSIIARVLRRRLRNAPEDLEAHPSYRKVEARAYAWVLKHKTALDD